uniref:Uncharacterized protein n=1 Tax=uncultured marine virus TaxID=186617 RepID=A0A0F7L578_9VIRU|nr:hypothetical protein [uncultured marine virus]
MIPYNIELQLEGDTDRIGNYLMNNLQFPLPDDPVIKARELEANRIIQQSFVTSIKQSLINNNNKKGE